MSQTATDTRSTSHRAALVVTELSSPTYLTTLTPPLVGLQAAGLVGLVWGALTTLFTSLIPLGFVMWGVRTGRLGSRRVHERSQRLVPLVVAAISVVTGLVVLVVAAAPQELAALVAAMVVGLTVTLAVTLKWKVSLHTSVAAGTVTVLGLTFGTLAAVVGVPLIAAVAWARIELKEHTLAQAVVGAVLGASVAAVTYPALL